MPGLLGEMTGVDYLFLGAAVIGGALFLIRLVLFFVGFHHGGADIGQADVGSADVGMDAGHLDAGAADAAHGAGYHPDATASSDVSFKTLSIQGVTAFFMMFGLVGLALRKESGISMHWSILGAVIGGAVTVWVVGKVFAMMTRFQSSGTLDMRNAIGQEGSVYLTIPAGGAGKAQVAIQNRLTVIDAVTEGNEAIKTGQRIRVVKVIEGNVLVVEKV